MKWCYAAGMLYVVVSKYFEKIKSDDFHTMDMVASIYELVFAC